MRELSVFVDESGNNRKDSKYYLLTLIFHDQGQSVTEAIDGYERGLADRRLDDIPLHLGPLMRGNDAYAFMDARTRGKYLSAFRSFANKAPFAYRTFAYEKCQFSGDKALFTTMRRDMTVFLFDHLDYFQSFDVVKIYYDNGQEEITRVLHSGFEYVFGRQAIIYRSVRPEEYRLQQVADYVCGIELAALKYEAASPSKTESIFFGTRREFLKNFLKKLRKHRLD